MDHLKDLLCVLLNHKDIPFRLTATILTKCANCGAETRTVINNDVMCKLPNPDENNTTESLMRNVDVSYQVKTTCYPSMHNIAEKIVFNCPDLIIFYLDRGNVEERQPWCVCREIFLPGPDGQVKYKLCMVTCQNVFSMIGLLDTDLINEDEIITEDSLKISSQPEEKKADCRKNGIMYMYEKCLSVEVS